MGSGEAVATTQPPVSAIQAARGTASRSSAPWNLRLRAARIRFRCVAQSYRVVTEEGWWVSRPTSSQAAGLRGGDWLAASLEAGWTMRASTGL